MQGDHGHGGDRTVASSGGAGGRTGAMDLASSSASGTPELRGLGKVLRVSGLQLLPCEMW